MFQNSFFGNFRQLSSRLQRFWKRILCGLRNLQLSLLPFRLPYFPLLVLFINNIKFHKQLSVANMFWIPWWKDDMLKKKSCKGLMRGKMCHFFLWKTTWYVGDSSSFFFKPQACILKLILCWLCLRCIKWHLPSSASLKPYLHLLGLNRLFWNMPESKFASRSQNSKKKKPPLMAQQELIYSVHSIAESLLIHFFLSVKRLMT